MPSLSQLAWTLAVWAVPVLFAITLHEVAHGWAARALGDRTAERAGRLSLNPLKHVDPVGTVAVPAVLLALGGFLFGWAKPVPVVMGNLGHPKRDMALVAAAGPAANLVMALAWALALNLALQADLTVLRLVATAGVLINLVLLVLNLLPVPPLDGSRVLRGVLPDPAARLLDRLEPWGLLIVLGLLATGLLGFLLGPPLAWSRQVIAVLAGLPPGALP